jgi:hypothetical protein
LPGIWRYAECDGVIIVLRNALRNAYGSTERLEQNLQGILFDREPRIPSRNAKDVLARAWQLPEEWTVALSVSVVIPLVLLTLVWQMARPEKRRRELLGV